MNFLNSSGSSKSCRLLPARQAEGAAALAAGRAARGRRLLLCLRFIGLPDCALALGLLRLLLLPAGAATHARHPGHPRHAAALGHPGHHLAGLEEPLDQVLHRADLDTGTLGDTGPARAVDDRRLLALGRGHRLDDRGGAVDVALVEVVDLVLHLPHAGQHAEQLGDGAHLPDLLHLGQEVVERELLGPFLDASLEAIFSASSWLKVCSAFSIRREHVTHVEDAGGHAVRVERVEVVQLLAVGGEHDLLAGDLGDRQGGTTAGVTVELGEHHAVEADAVAEGLGGVDRVLTDHRVDDEEDLVRG